MQGKDQKDHHSFSRSSDSAEAASGISYRRDTSYDDNFNYPYCQDINKYEKLCKIGQGTFGCAVFFSCTVLLYWVTRMTE